MNTKQKMIKAEEYLLANAKNPAEIVKHTASFLIRQTMGGITEPQLDYDALDLALMDLKIFTEALDGIVNPKSPTKPAELPKGYNGWALLDGEKGRELLISTLKPLSASQENDVKKTGHGEGLLIGVAATLCACGMEYEDAMQLVWQLLPTDTHKDCVPPQWQDEFKAKIKKD